jgi:hypothetical protein
LAAEPFLSYLAENVREKTNPGHIDITLLTMFVVVNMVSAEKISPGGGNKWERNAWPWMACWLRQLWRLMDIKITDANQRGTENIRCLATILPPSRQYGPVKMPKAPPMTKHRS